jgi:hypothetical protein
MNRDPYAAGPLPQASGETVGWTTGELVSAAWEAFGRNAPILIAANTLAFIVVQMAQVPGVTLGAFGALGQTAPGLVPAPMSRLVQSAVSLPFVIVASSFFNVGIMRISLQVARGEEPKFDVVFSGGDRLLAMLGLNVLMGFALVVGFALLLVPGVILSVGWCLAPYYLVDAKLGPVQALRASWHATKGWRGAISVVLLAAAGIYLAGLACCCMGLIVAAPLAMVLYAMLYVRIRGRVGGEPPDPYAGRGDWPGEWPR